MIRTRSLACAFVVLLAAAAPAGAEVIGYKLLVSGNPVNFPAGPTAEFPASTNTPIIRLTDISNQQDITRLTLTIGDTTRNFDSARSESASTGAAIVATLNSPDHNNSGGVRSDLVDYNFTGFNPGEYFQFQPDVDIDNADSVENFETVFFNNGANTPNAQVTVFFANGTSLSQSFPENPAQDPGADHTNEYTLTQSVPEPNAATLLALGVIGAVASCSVRRRGLAMQSKGLISHTR